MTLLKEHGDQEFKELKSWKALTKLPIGIVGLFVLGMENGFKYENATIIGEQDILGERMIRTQRRRRAETFIAINVSARLRL